MMPRHKASRDVRKPRKLNSNNKFNKFINRKIVRLKANLNISPKTNTQVNKMKGFMRRKNALSPTDNMKTRLVSNNQRYFSPIVQPYSLAKKAQTSKRAVFYNASMYNARGVNAVVHRGFPTPKFIISNANSRNRVSASSSISIAFYMCF